jgi:hypothetical protein
MLFDAVRGATKYLNSNTTNTEATDAQSLSSFNSNGFSVGNNVAVNTNTEDYVAWNWKANGSGATNLDGTITSTVSANTNAGISVVGYTNNNTASQSIGHGLGVTPKVIITKRLTGSGWGFFGPILGVDKYMYLDTTDAQATASGYMPAPSSTVVNTGTNIWSALNSGTDDSLLYCFAEVEGFSSFGSYTGNGSTDGPFVYCGFSPAFVMVKKTNAANDWAIWDSARDTYNVSQRTLLADLPNAEYNGNYLCDFLSNGFKLKNDVGISNDNGSDYIYMAFAENPFKYANAR